MHIPFLNRKSNSSTPKKVRKNGLIGAVANLFNSVVGLGIFALPYTLLNGGVYFGLLFGLLCVFLICYTSALLIKLSQDNEKITSYGELCLFSLGKIGFNLFTMMMFLVMFGYCVVYNILFRQQISEIISDFINKTFQRGDLVLLGTSFIFILPLCLLKNMSNLAFSSIVSAVSVVVIILIIGIRSPVYHTEFKLMTIPKMLLIEKNLHTERAVWLCNLVGKSAYTAEIDSAPLNEITNFKSIVQHLHNLSLCGKQIDAIKVNDNIKNFDEVEKTIPTDKYVNGEKVDITWEKAIGDAHTNYLFDNYSLNPEGAKSHKNFTLHSFIKFNAILVVGTYASAFICQQCTYSIHYSSKKTSTKDWMYTLLIGYILIFIVCFTLAFVGYFTQQYQTLDFVFSKMKPRFVGLKSPDIATNIGRLLLVITIVLTFPMQFYCGRVNLILIVKYFVKKDTKKVNNIIFYSTTFSMFLVALVLGLFVDKAVDAFSLVGSAFASPLIYIFPILCMFGKKGGLRSVYKDAINSGNKAIMLDFLFPISILIFGITMTIFSTAFNILSIAGIEVNV